MAFGTALSSEIGAGPGDRRLPIGGGVPGGYTRFGGALGSAPMQQGAPTAPGATPQPAAGSGQTRTLPTGVYGYDAPPGQPVQSLPPGTATQPGNVAATAPLPYQAFGQTAQINPAMASPFDQQGYFQQYAQMLQQSMSPYFQQQQQQLEESLRARGIQDSGAAGQLQGNLLGQQSATLAGQEAPFLGQAFGYANQDVMANQNAANEAALYNANAYQQGVTQNYDAYNNYLQQLLGLGGADYGALQGAYLNSFGPNTGVQSGYNSALSGTQNVFGNVYGSAIGAQGQEISSAFGAAGAAMGAGG